MLECHLIHHFQKNGTCEQLSDTYLIIITDFPYDILFSSKKSLKRTMASRDRILLHKYPHRILSPDNEEVKKIHYALKYGRNYYATPTQTYLIDTPIGTFENNLFVPKEQAFLSFPSKKISFSKSDVRCLNTHLSFTYGGALGTNGPWNHGNNK